MLSLLVSIGVFCFAAGASIEPFYAGQLKRITDKMYEGCYQFDPNNLDLPHLVSKGDPFMTRGKCGRYCRDAGFRFGGLVTPSADASECYCGSSASRLQEEAPSCDSPCPGDFSQDCGGTNSIAIYYVNTDTRYAGCYQDDPVDRDLPASQGNTVNAADCLNQCLDQDYKFAGIQNGGQCFCGDTYGTHGEAPERLCYASCDGYGGQSCGGENNTNAIYWTQPAMEFSMDHDKALTKMYDSLGDLSGIATQMFTIYPGLRSFISSKLMIYSSVDIVTPVEDALCTDNCYKDCGTLEYFGSLEETAVLRKFHLRTSELNDYIPNENNHERVYIYAQTVVIDSDVSVPYALLIRARQILLDRSSSQIVETTSSHNLNIDVEEVKRSGPYPDLMFQKQSYMCSRILLEAGGTDYMNAAYGILKEIVTSPSSSPEQKSFIGTVRGFMAKDAGVYRSSAYYVPTYTKSHISRALELYGDRIQIYKDDLDKLQNAQTSNELFIQYAEDMNRIYVEADIYEATQAHKEAMQSVKRANGTYNRMAERYDMAVVDLENAEQAFLDGIEDAKDELIKKGLFNFIKMVFWVGYGVVTGDVVTSVGSIAGIFDGSVRGMAGTIKQAAAMVNHVREMVVKQNEHLERLDDMLNDYDPSKYEEDIEMAAGMKESIIEWDNLKGFSDMILSDGDVIGIGGSQQFALELMDLCNWGKAVSESMVEMAENTRDVMSKRTTLDAKRKQAERVEEKINEMKQNHALREQTLITMMEETMDVRIDLNMALMSFCQAYFYENLFQCGTAYKPTFGGDLTVLLQRINAAKSDGILVTDPPFTFTRGVTIKDALGMVYNETCFDAKECPIAYFQKHRNFYYTVELDNQDLIDLEKVRVAEIQLEVVGAKSSDPDCELLQMRIEMSGDFYSKAFGTTYNFITRSMTCPYEYDFTLPDGHDKPTIRCDVYDPLRDVVNHIMPYTTWVMYLYEPMSSCVDVSQVTEIEMRFRGSANISRKKISLK